MGKVKSALEIAMEKAGKLGRLSSEERERIRDEEEVMSILKDFYQDTLDANGLWQRLKGSKPSLLTMIQINLIDSLSLRIQQDEFQKRKQGILAVETLKMDPKTSVIESALHSIEAIQREYQEIKEKVIADLKSELERNPQLRMKSVPTPNGKTVMQLTVSVDEAVKTKLADFLSEHEKQYSNEFSYAIEELKKLVKVV